ncbi:MAG: DUF2807 domain-containing protein [Bacteroidetes bacterium]|nr:DUF2807 domain-containing protein [Bacteroidota bacterium]
MNTHKVYLPAAIFLLGVFLVTIACDDDQGGSGVLATKNYDFRDFSSIVAERGFDVRVMQDSSWAVAVTTDENLKDFLDVFRSGSTLLLEIKPSSGVSFSALRADVRMPTFSSVVLSGGANCDIGDGFVSYEPASAVLSAGSRFEGSLRSGDVSLVLSGGSDVLLRGAGRNGSLIASGGSRLDLRNFVLDSVSVAADGGSTVYINLTGRIDATVSGGSSVYYTGTPEFGEIDVSAGSTFRRLGG